MKIVIVGAGNVAFQLADRFSEKGVVVAQLFNRNIQKAREIAEKHQIDFTNDPSKLYRDADVYLFCISDDGIGLLANELKQFIPDRLVAHTSGAVDSHILHPFFANYGGFYPLQTFTKNSIPNFEKIPVMITANSESNLSTLKILASKISNVVQCVTDEERLLYHLAAVISNNFTNHLFGKAYGLLKNNDLSFDLLMPLIEETVQKIHFNNPDEIQTGPARRGDMKTIKEHLNLLNLNPELKKIYIDISNSINPKLKL